MTLPDTWRPGPSHLVPGDPHHPVVDDEFLDVDALQQWQDDLDARGLRATGSASHQAYVDDLVARLAAVGVEQVWTEDVPLRRWEARNWALLIGGDDVSVVSPVPYSGSTSAQGVSGPLSTVPAAGVIGVVEIGLLPLTAQVFDLLDWDAPHLPVHGGDYSAEEPYRRVWLSQELMRQELARFKEAGAAGVVLVVDMDESEIRNGYLLYDGIHRDLPALFVGRRTGKQLLGRIGDSGTLVLEADTEDAVSRNVIGLIPGATDELVAVQSHTDGSNGLEDNGPEAILAMAQYLARVPREDLPRGVLVLLTSGHFVTEQAWGLEAFLARHSSDIVPRIAASMCLEHLGALQAPTDYVEATPYEFGCCFATRHRAVVSVARAALEEAAVTEARVVRPMVPHTKGTSPDGTTWPGDGGPFWHTSGIPSFNFITGPNYLLNVESVVDLIDVNAMRRQAIAFTRATLALASIPWGALRTEIDVDPSG